ncbi:reverse transcriptase domain-containing protein, partial [Rosenbergiella epipactidis]|uniref:reverse transcriptase domain-containing protein n=1 Tax=Rosenbergiella epipactidis TaxID=1544694 RepID=UPI001F4E3C7F
MHLNLNEKLGCIQGKKNVEIFLFLCDMPKKYKVYSIPKRNGGERVIAQPTKEIKNIQSDLINHLRGILKVHDVATAYRDGLGIKHNAEKHSKNQYLLKMDFSSFFNSITPEILLDCFLLNEIKLSKNDVLILRNVLFWNKSKENNGKLSLSVGAPSSPFISNAIMYSFDCEVNALCE